MYMYLQDLYVYYVLVTKFMYTYAVGATFAVLPAIRQEKDFEGQSPQCSGWPKG